METDLEIFMELVKSELDKYLSPETNEDGSEMSILGRVTEVSRQRFYLVLAIKDIIEKLEKSRNYFAIANCHNVYTDDGLEILQDAIRKLKDTSNEMF